MNFLYFLIAFVFTGPIFPQANGLGVDSVQVYQKDTLITVESISSKGFEHSYTLYIPEGTPKNKEIPLLVEPNNTGFTSDSIEIHLKSAIELAGKSSVGNNVSRILKIPLLVPVFPRPASRDLIYTHALDRDVMIEKENDLERLDLQLIAMVTDAKQKLQSLDVLTAEKIFMTGFSASGTFVNRFAFIHPNIIEAVATGGLNSKLMLPLKELENFELNYPLGINDLEKITGKNFEFELYRKIPQFIYMGEEDDNDAVKYNDAYDEEERKIIFSAIGEDMQSRWRTSQDIYRQLGVNAQFRTYVDVGHYTTTEMLWEIINFFAKEK